jgi:hypothetical protein
MYPVTPSGTEGRGVDRRAVVAKVVGAAGPEAQGPSHLPTDGTLGLSVVSAPATVLPMSRAWLELTAADDGASPTSDTIRAISWIVISKALTATLRVI